MSFKYKNGNLLNSGCEYICHQVNCLGVMGAGIAKQIKEKWPIVYDEYQEKYRETNYEILKNYGGFENSPSTSEVLLGDIQLIQVEEDTTVINMFSQEYYGNDGRRYTSYDAFWICLNKIKQQVPKGSIIGFPMNIGCGLGGANWKVISTMISEVLGKDYSVLIYCYPEIRKASYCICNNNDVDWDFCK